MCLSQFRWHFPTTIRKCSSRVQLNLSTILSDWGGNIPSLTAVVTLYLRASGPCKLRKGLSYYFTYTFLRSGRLFSFNLIEHEHWLAQQSCWFLCKCKRHCINKRPFDIKNAACFVPGSRIPLMNACLFLHIPVTCGHSRNESLFLPWWTLIVTPIGF